MRYRILLSAKMIALTRKNMTDLMARNISSENERTTVGVESGLRGKADRNRRNRA
jgi:hypothetical protein